MNDEAIKRALEFDPLYEAERVVGESYKNKEAVTGLGMLFTATAARQKEALLKAAGDTTFQNKLDRYISIVKGAGFEQVLALPFQSSHKPYYGELVNPLETFYVFAHRDGMILVFDTFGTNSVNSGTLYFEIRVNEPGKWPSFTATSGGFTDYDRNNPENACSRFNGSFDAREGLLFHIREVRNAGTLHNPWENKNSWLWLNHYADSHTAEKIREREGYAAESAFWKNNTDTRIAMLPSWVRGMIR